MICFVGPKIYDKILVISSLIIIVFNNNSGFALISEFSWKGSCASEKVGTEAAYGIFEWPQTSIGDRSTLPCPYNPDSSASRECLYANQIGGGGGVWAQSDVEQCNYRNKNSKILFDLAHVIEDNTNKIKSRVLPYNRYHC